MPEHFPDSYARILEAILRSAFQIRDLLRTHPLVGVGAGGGEGSTNSSGDLQKPIDLLSHEIMVRELSATEMVCTLYSEEVEEAIQVTTPLSATLQPSAPPVPGRLKTLGWAPYAVAFDPLDGSSNIDCNVSVGTIFSIYRNQMGVGGDAIRALRNRDIVCAGYVVYGFATEMVVTFIDEGRLYSIEDQHPVHRYLLGEGVGEERVQWLGTLRIPENHKKIYAVNEGNDRAWNPTFRSFIETRFKGQGYTQRYVASMVADIHRTLLYGGFFAYPGDSKNPQGKLRLLYECMPMAILMKNAGGWAVNEEGTSIWNIQPKPDQIHQKMPILLGSMEDILFYGSHKFHSRTQTQAPSSS